MAGATSAGVDDRRQGHEEDAVREVLDRLGRELQGEARLARAARPGQRQQAGRRQQAACLGDLVLAADEAGRLDGQVVGRGVERAQRREVGGQAGDDELADPLRGARDP